MGVPIREGAQTRRARGPRSGRRCFRSPCTTRRLSFSGRAGESLAKNPKKRTPQLRRSGSSKPPGRSALGRGLACRLGGRGGRCRGCLALGVGPGPERGDVRRAQRGVPQDFAASALLAEGGGGGGGASGRASVRERVGQCVEIA